MPSSRHVFDRHHRPEMKQTDPQHPEKDKEKLQESSLLDADDTGLAAEQSNESYLQTKLQVKDPTVQTETVELSVKDIIKPASNVTCNGTMGKNLSSSDEEYFSPQEIDLPVAAAVTLPTKEKVANLKEWFEARARELKPKSLPQSGQKRRHSRLSQREVFNPELLTWQEKKHLFERKIRQSRRWSKEIDQAKANMTRRYSKKF